MTLLAASVSHSTNTTTVAQAAGNAEELTWGKKEQNAELKGMELRLWPAFGLTQGNKTGLKPELHAL